jgi:broad specificity phosphatase PhoE
MATDDNDNATQTPTMTPVPLVSSILPPLSEGSRRIYLVRHGETDWNKLGKIQGGGFDIPLNDNGRQQALTTALALEDIPLGVVASSHLSRAKETADILWHRHNATVQDKRVIFEGLGEMRFGEFEGLAWRDQDVDPALAERFKTISKELKHDLNKSFPGGGESTKDVQKRSVTALDQILKDFPDEQHIAIVSHGRTNKVLIASTALGDVMQYPTVKQGSKCNHHVAASFLYNGWKMQKYRLLKTFHLVLYTIPYSKILRSMSWMWMPRESGQCKL